MLALWSLDSAFFAEAAPIRSNHAHFHPPQPGIFDRHPEQHVFVLLVVRSKRILMQQNQLCFIGAGFDEIGEMFSDAGYQVGFSLLAFFDCRHAKRIADSG